MSEEDKKEEREEKTKPLQKEKVERADKVTRLIPARIVETKGLSVLLEWSDKDELHDLHRSFVPVDAVTFNDAGQPLVNLDKLSSGIAYGLDWSKVELPPIDPQDLAHELRLAGFWTLQDLQNDPRKLSITLLKICGLSRQKLMEFARSEEKNK